MNISSTHEIRTRSAAETERVAEIFGEACQGGELFLLRGELGTGKTCFVRGLARGLQCDPDEVCSPSYTLMHSYTGRKDLHHFDVYFTSEPRDLERSELAETLEQGAVVAVEWGDRFAQFLPADRVEIELEHAAVQERILRISPRGPRSAALWESLPREAGPLQNC